MNINQTTKKSKKVNKECDLGVDLDDTFKTEDPVLSIVLKAIEMIDWMARNFIPK